MKISVIADCHLNHSLYKGIIDKDDSSMSFRTADFLKAFDSIISKNINEIKPDLIVVNGDVFDSFDPANNIRAFFYDKLRQLIIAKIPIILLIGNHDVCRKHHPLKPLLALDLKNVKVIEKPQIINFKDHILLLFPYSLEIEQGKISLKNQFLKFVEEAKIKLKDEKNKDILFFGHFPVVGAKINSYYSSNDDSPKIIIYNRREEDISASDLDSIGAKYVFLGDLHEFQTLQTRKCVAMYTGSIEKINMSEIDQKKGFVVYDDSVEEIPDMGRCRFIEYNDCRPMVNLRGTSQDILKSLDLLKRNIDGAIVKISFIGNEKELENFAVSLEEIKKQIRDKVHPIHIYHEQKVVDEEEEKAASLIEHEIMEHGHVSEKDVIDAVADMIKERESDQKEQKILIEMASDIYKEAMEG